MCCAALVTVFTQSEHLHTEENSASGVSEEYAATDVTGASSGTVTVGDRLAINPDFVYYTVTVKSEYLKGFMMHRMKSCLLLPWICWNIS